MVVVGIIGLLALPGLAKAERSALEVATIKAASDCVASTALNNPNITMRYRQGRLKEITDWIVLKSSACDNQLTAMRLLHDRLYGPGKGQRFLLGDYLADLPRAVGERIGAEVARREADQNRDKTSAYAQVPARPEFMARPDASSGNNWLASGNSWLAACNDGAKYPFCVGHVRGVADGLTIWAIVDKNRAPVCVPEGVTAGQLMDVTTRYISNHPESRHEEAGTLIGRSFLEMWPCATAWSKDDR
jgi:hypothetical protein